MALKLRLYQFLGRTGKFQTKRELIESIKNSEIALDGKVIRNPEYQFNPKKHMVTWKGEKVNTPLKGVYIILNKPERYLCSRLTSHDKELGKRSVFSILSRSGMNLQLLSSLFCVGRLDENTSGLLLITNDGQFSSTLTQPKSAIPKMYEAIVAKPLFPAQITAIENGVTIQLEENGEFTPYQTHGCAVKMVTSTKLRLSLTEGKKREVRRIFESLGNTVLSLQRVAIGKIRLADLKLDAGKYVAVDKEYILKRLK